MSNHNLKRHSSFLITILVIVIFFSSIQNFIYADQTLSKNKLNEEFLRCFLNDFKEVAVSPKDWQSNDFFKLSATLAGVTFLIGFDEEINGWFQRNRNSSSKDISRLISPLGHGVFLGSFLTALYASGEIFDNNQLRKTALLSLESWMTSGTIVLVIKFLTGRLRPQENKNNHTFHPFSLRPRFHSFPSGHASSVFAVATMIADRSNKFYVDFLAYNLAALAALTRIHDSKHWASDVFIGSAIGYFVAKKVSALNRKREDGKIRLNFEFSPQKQAVILSFYF